VQALGSIEKRSVDNKKPSRRGLLASILSINEMGYVASHINALL